MTIAIRDLKRRIRSTRKIWHVTRTLERVAAVRLNQRMTQFTQFKPYLQWLEELRRELDAAPGDPASALAGPPRTGRKAILIFGADKTLCGAFNHALLNKVETILRDEPEAGTGLIVVGKVIRNALRHGPYLIDTFHPQPHGSSLESDLDALIDTVIRSFRNGTYARIDVLYSRYVSRLRQVPTLVQVLPVPALPTHAQPDQTRAGSFHEPDTNTLLARLLPQWARARLRETFLNSLISELAARQFSMGGASENSRAMTQDLTIEYNRTRQETITAEVREITLGRLVQ